MSKKAIFLQFQGTGSGNISSTKEAGFVSVAVDNIKITIDAYDGSSYSGRPREDSKMEIMDSKEVFQVTPEQLLQIIRFYVDYSASTDTITHYKNRFHYIPRDALKKPLKY